MTLLKVLAFIFIIAGAVIVFGARKIVSVFELDKNEKCDHADQMTEEELSLYKSNRAVVNVKMLGMLLTLPGIILILILYR